MLFQKNIPVLEATTHRTRVSRDAQNVSRCNNRRYRRYCACIEKGSNERFSFWMEKPVVITNGTARFHRKVFVKKRNNFKCIPLFSFLSKWPEYHWTIFPHHAYVPCSLVRNAVYFPKLPVERTVPFDSTTEQLFFSIQMESARELYCSFWRKILTGFSLQMESARTATLCSGYQ